MLNLFIPSDVSKPYPIWAIINELAVLILPLGEVVFGDLDDCLGEVLWKSRCPKSLGAI